MARHLCSQSVNEWFEVEDNLYTFLKPNDGITMVAKKTTGPDGEPAWASPHDESIIFPEGVQVMSSTCSKPISGPGGAFLGFEEVEEELEKQKASSGGQKLSPPVV